MRKRQHRHPVWFVTIAACFAFTLLGLTPSVRAGESPNDLVIVANKSVPLDAVSAEFVKSIFLKLRTGFGGGIAAVPVHADAGSPEREAFDRLVLGMTVKDEVRMWEDRKVMYGVSAPLEKVTRGDERMKKVFATKGAVSYVLRKNLVAKVVKVLLVIPAAAAPGK